MCLYRPFIGVLPVHVAVPLWKWIHVPVTALFGVLALCTWLYASGRESTCSIRFVGAENVAVRLWTWIHVPVPGFFGVLAL